jgi:hypothetical protein
MPATSPADDGLVEFRGHCCARIDPPALTTSIA